MHLKTLASLFAGGALVALSTLVGCGSSDRPAASPTPASTLWMKPRPDLACTPTTPTAESDCHRKDATNEYGAPLFCSGVMQPDRGPPTDDQIRQTPCTCITQSEKMRCMSMP